MMHSTIETIAQLKNDLQVGLKKEGGPHVLKEGGLDILKAIKMPKSEWEAFCSWNEKRYTRNCIASCPDYELMLMCWKKSHVSPIHNYHFQESFIKVLQGELTIEVFKVDRKTKKCEFDYEMVVRENEYTFLMDTMGFHRVKNALDDHTVSLHLNVSKIDQWEVFHPQEKAFEIVCPSYDTLSDDCN